MEATSVKRILVIDDNRAIHADFRKILCQSGDAGAIDQAAAALFGQPQASSPVRQYELEFACQGQEGLARVCESLEAGRPFALAFIDMRMPPGWDGLQTIEAIWKKDPDLQVVICTAYSDYSWSDIVTRWAPAIVCSSSASPSTMPKSASSPPPSVKNGVWPARRDSR